MPTKVKSTKPRTAATAAPRRKPAASAKRSASAGSRNSSTSTVSALKRRKTPAKPGTKQAQLISLLSTSSGTTLADMINATGWQPHSVRGVISGVLRKKLGLKVDTAVIEGTRRYRIVAA